MLSSLGSKLINEMHLDGTCKFRAVLHLLLHRADLEVECVLSMTFIVELLTAYPQLEQVVVNFLLAK